MSIALADRVQEMTTTTGTGTLSLAGAKTGFQGFVAAGLDGEEVPYTTVGQAGGGAEGEWEVGIGTVTDAAPDTLSRTTVLASSNAGAAVNFSAGTKDVFLTVPAAMIWRPAAFADVTSGDITVTATSAASPTTVHDGLSVAAQAGDVLAVTVGFSPSGAGDSRAVRINGVTLDDEDAQVNFVGPGSLGVRAWGVEANVDVADPEAKGGTQHYAVQAGDIRSDGTVKVRLVAWLSSSGTRTIQASSASALHFAVSNLGPA